MKFGKHFFSTLLRLAFLATGALYAAVAVIVAVYGVPSGGASLWDLVFILLILCVFVGFWLCLLAQTAPGELTREGIYVRVFLIRRFYAWESIRQAGILWRMGKGMHYNEIVLLKPGGSPRRYRDKLFIFRNLFHLIHIPYSPELRDYIARHYGPLDFDLSDGRPERSEVI